MCLILVDIENVSFFGSSGPSRLEFKLFQVKSSGLCVRVPLDR